MYRERVFSTTSRPRLRYLEIPKKRGCGWAEWQSQISVLLVGRVFVVLGMLSFVSVPFPFIHRCDVHADFSPRVAFTGLYPSFPKAPANFIGFPERGTWS